MKTVKLFKHGGSQAVRLPKDFRLDGAEVLIERRGEAVTLRPKPRITTLAVLARHMRDRFPAGAEFPARRQPKAQQKRDPARIRQSGISGGIKHRGLRKAPTKRQRVAASARSHGKRGAS